MIRILLVDDNEADIKITVRALSKATVPSTVHTVYDGEQALQFLKKEHAPGTHVPFERPDLILLDLNMPRMDGFEFLRRAKSELTLKTIPVVIFSSSNNTKDIQHAYDLGAASYIQKPIDYNELIQLVESFNRYWGGINRFTKEPKDKQP